MAVSASDLLAYAASNLGKPYQFGAAGPGAFDCSGFTQYVFGHFGVHLPHHSEDQANLGQSVAKNQIQAGDLVFSDWGDGANSHVGIATGPGQIIDAPHSGAVVRYDNLDAGYLNHVTAVRRFTDVTGQGKGGILGTGIPSPEQLIGADSAGLMNLVLPDQVKQFFTEADQAVTGALWWFNPTHLTRVVSGIAGIALILVGVLFLSREVRT